MTMRKPCGSVNLSCLHYTTQIDSSYIGVYVRQQPKRSAIFVPLRVTFFVIQARTKETKDIPKASSFHFNSYIILNLHAFFTIILFQIK